VEHARLYLLNLWNLTLEAAPWLLLGLIVSGLTAALIPTDRITRWLGGRGVWPAFKAALIGTPIPVCSCGVLPIALGLRRQGASRGATVSFLIATPENGVDSIAVSYALLGPVMTVVRPVAAVISATMTGWFVEVVGGDSTKSAKPQAACCGSDCCETTPRVGSLSAAARLRDGLRNAFTDLLDDLAPWLLAGLLVAAALTTLVPPDSFSGWGSGVTAKLVMLVVGLPMYICATASTPVAAAMILAGVSPGTALVFLLAGPASNFSTMIVIGREMGSRTLVGYLAGISVTTLALGVAVDALLPAMGWSVDARAGEGTELLPEWFSVACVAVLVLAAIRPLRRVRFLKSAKPQAA
jgi:uncharacterized protein